MKIVVAADALVAHMDGEVVVLHAGTKDYHHLNETGQHIWRGIEQGSGVDTIVDGLLAAYEIDREQARAAVLRLIDELASAGIVEVRD
jgi:hypothetical protein